MEIHAIIDARLLSGTAQGQILFWDDTLKRWVFAEIAELFWDDVNKRLGIVNASPASELDVGTGEITTGSINRASGTLTLEIGGTVEISITSATVTLGGNLIIPDAGFIGSASDTDAIQIEADGDVVLTQNLLLTKDITTNRVLPTGTTPRLGETDDRWQSIATQVLDANNVTVNEDLTVTGDITCDELTLKNATVDYKLTRGVNANAITLEALTGDLARFQLSSSTGNALGNVFLELFGLGYSGSTTNKEWLQIGWLSNAGAGPYVVRTRQGGSGVYQPLTLSADGSTTQLELKADGSISMGSGNVIISAGDLGVRTVTPTLPLSVLEKSGNTTIGGFAVKLTNKTGGNTVAGQLVVASTATDDAFATAGADSQEVIGIVLDAGVADGSEAWVVRGGIADVLMDGGGSAHGDRIISSATGGSADVWNVGGSAAIHFQEIGHCIETRVGAGLARCMLHFN